MVTPPALPAHVVRKKETRGRPKKDDVTRHKYPLEIVREMLNHVPQHDRDMWRSVGVILGREFLRSDEAWAAYVEWSDRWGGKKGRNHDEIMREAFYDYAPAGDATGLAEIVPLLVT